MQALEGIGGPPPEPTDGIVGRIYTVVDVAKFIFHWGFIPTVIYFGE